MAAWVAALLLVAVLLVLLSCRCRGSCPAGAREPPVAPGGLPLLGNALQLARHGATFVRQQRQAVCGVGGGRRHRTRMRTGHVASCVHYTRRRGPPWTSKHHDLKSTRSPSCTRSWATCSRCACRALR